MIIRFKIRPGDSIGAPDESDRPKLVLLLKAAMSKKQLNQAKVSRQVAAKLEGGNVSTEASLLSKVMSQKQGFSVARAHAYAQVLDIPVDEILKVRGSESPQPAEQASDFFLSDQEDVTQLVKKLSGQGKVTFGELAKELMWIALSK